MTEESEDTDWSEKQLVLFRCPDKDCANEEMAFNSFEELVSHRILTHGTIYPPCPKSMQVLTPIDSVHSRIPTTVYALQQFQDPSIKPLLMEKNELEIYYKRILRIDLAYQKSDHLDPRRGKKRNIIIKFKVAYKRWMDGDSVERNRQYERALKFHWSRFKHSPFLPTDDSPDDRSSTVKKRHQRENLVGYGVNWLC